MDYSSDYLNALLAKCIQCGACDAICPRDLEPSLIIRNLRSGQSLGQTNKGYVAFVARQILNHPPLLETAGLSLALLQKLPRASGLLQKIKILSPHINTPLPPPKPTADTPLLYYPGCLAHHLQTDIEQASRYLASLCGYKLSIPKSATCCGIASSSSGKGQEAAGQALRNIKAYATTEGPILTSCGSCYAQLTSYPKLFKQDSQEHQEATTFASRVQEFSTFFVKENKLQSHAAPQRLYYHDPCHLRFGPQPIIKAPRQLIRNLNGEAVVNEDHPLGCCGQGGLFALIEPSLSQAIFKEASQEMIGAPPATVLTTCSSCLMAWQQNSQDSAITSLHLSVFLAKRCENC